jgi:hypothetical protein
MQMSAARTREKRARAAGLRAVSVTYDRSQRRVVIELSNGCVFGFPAQSIPWLRNATIADLMAVEVSPSGSGLRWDALDVDLSVPGLLLSSIGRVEKTRELARLAGSAKSDAKARAARANGAKGGRPATKLREG